MVWYIVSAPSTSLSPKMGNFSSLLLVLHEASPIEMIAIIKKETAWYDLVMSCFFIQFNSGENHECDDDKPQQAPHHTQCTLSYNKKYYGNKENCRHFVPYTELL